jgi:nitrile hydratase accessory protein
MVAEDQGPGAELEGPAAPPRKNGEIVFSAPWQSRIFGLTMALHAAGTFTWDEFRARLIAAIGRTDAAGAGDAYWQSWAEAFEALLDTKGLCAAHDLERRARTLAARPPGHDHAL